MVNPDHHGNLIDDVKIGDIKDHGMPDLRQEDWLLGIPKVDLWAYDPNGINQIGCIYTAQGFEFDYVGVIFGNDLYYNPDKGKWEGRRSSHMILL